MKKTITPILKSKGTYFIPPFSLPDSIIPRINPPKNVVTEIARSENLKRKLEERFSCYALV